MVMVINARMVRHLRRYSQVASLAVTVLGIVGMVAWLLDISELTQLFTSLPPMKFNTAVCFALSGGTLAGLHAAGDRRWGRMVRLGGGLVALVCLLSLSQDLTGQNWGIDELIVRDPTSDGRMAPMTATSFICVGLALMLVGGSTRLHTLAQTTSIIAFLIMTLALLEYLYTPTTLAKIEPFASVSVQTTLGFLILTTATLCCGIERGRSAIFVTNSIAGYVVRRAIVMTVIIVPCIGWLEIKGSQWGWYPTSFAFALFAGSLIAVIGSLAWRMVGEIDRIEQQRRAAVEALHEQEQLYRDLFEGVDDAITVHDPDGNLLEVNTAAVRRLGYSRDELLRMRTSDLDKPDYGSKYPERIEHQLRAGTLTDIVGAHITKDGREIPIHVNTRVIRYKGQPAVLAVVRDISGLRKAEQDAINLALERERSRILTQFITEATHEFRTPLSILSTSIDLIPHLTDEVKKTTYINRSHEQIRRISRLIAQLVLITQLENEAVDQFTPVTIAMLMEQLQAEMDATTPNRSVTFHYADTDLAQSVIQIDAHYLKTALLEIMDNAVRYGPADSPIQVQAARAGDTVVITVTDHGVGIDPAQLPLIFNRFYRHDQAHTTPGFGLGLPIAKLIVERHHGRIEVESELAVGTTVRVILPTTQPISPPKGL